MSNASSFFAPTVVSAVSGVHCAGLPCPVPIISSAAAGSSSSSRRSDIGMLTSHVGDLGMAHIKVAPALAAAEGQGAPLQLQLGGGVEQQVVPQRPSWWPSEWGREEAAPAGQQQQQGQQ